MRDLGGIDLHANNRVVVVADEHDRVVYEKRHRNDLPTILDALAPSRAQLHGIAVECTYKVGTVVEKVPDTFFSTILRCDACGEDRFSWMDLTEAALGGDRAGRVGV